MRTCIDYYNKKHELISEKLIGNVTEVGTEKQMTIFPNIKEQMVIFRFRDRLAIRQDFLNTTTKKNKKIENLPLLKICVLAKELRFMEANIDDLPSRYFRIG